MADKKMSTIILGVDLDCCCCVKMITKTLKKFPEIQTQTLNHAKKTVTISGPFDPEKLMKRICCKAGKYITSYEIVIDKPPKITKPVPKPPLKISTQTDPVPVCCKQCHDGQGGGPCWQGWPPQPCLHPIWVRPCFEGYEAGPYSSPYAPPSGCQVL